MENITAQSVSYIVVFKLLTALSKGRIVIESIEIILRVTKVIRIYFVEKRKGRNKVERSALRDNNNKVKLIVLF